MLNTCPAHIKKFTYTQTDYLNWIKDFAAAFGYQHEDNSVSFNFAGIQSKASAYFIEDGFTACVNNFQINEDCLFARQPSEKFGVIIHLYFYQAPGQIEYKLGDVFSTLENGSYYTLRLINAQTAQQLKFDQATVLRGISISLENCWITKNFSHRIMEVFTYLKKVNYFKEFINAKHQRLMNEILDVPDNHPYRNIYIKSRIWRIVDRLLENLLQRDISESPEKINEEDFINLQKIETLLTKSYDQVFPGIEKLSRISLMSESKLKKIFKEAFGMGLYEYFQKNRMHIAKEHIISGKYSISEVGIILGYQNLSNFSTAFRKEFNCLPSELDFNN